MILRVRQQFRRHTGVWNIQTSLPMSYRNIQTIPSFSLRCSPFQSHLPCSPFILLLPSSLPSYSYILLLTCFHHWSKYKMLVYCLMRGISTVMHVSQIHAGKFCQLFCSLSPLPARDFWYTLCISKYMWCPQRIILWQEIEYNNDERSKMVSRDTVVQCAVDVIRCWTHVFTWCVLCFCLYCCLYAYVIVVSYHAIVVLVLYNK